MSEIVIVISDLYFAPNEAGGPSDANGGGAASVTGVTGTTGTTGTSPGIEHAVRFGRRRSIEGEGGWRPWLARWLGHDDLAGVAPAVIAASADDLTAAVDRPDSTVWMATPVYLIAGLTSLHLDRRSILRLSPTDLEGFAADFDRTFGDSGLHLQPLPSGDFLLRGPTTLSAATTEPSRALVADLEASLPKGGDAKAFKRLGAELEMWLHAHPLNEVRRRRGELPVSSLWLWGGGASSVTLASEASKASEASEAADNRGSQAPSLSSFGSSSASSAGSPATHAEIAFGSDPYLAGLWNKHGSKSQPVPTDQLTSLLRNKPRAQRVILVTEVTPLLHANPHWTVFEALAEIDRLFVSPAIAALRTKAVDCVVVIANNTELRIGRRDRLKFWRRRLSIIRGLQA